MKFLTGLIILASTALTGCNQIVSQHIDPAPPVVHSIPPKTPPHVVVSRSTPPPAPTKHLSNSKDFACIDLPVIRQFQFIERQYNTEYSAYQKKKLSPHAVDSSIANGWMGQLDLMRNKVESSSISGNDDSLMLNDAIVNYQNGLAWMDTMFQQGGVDQEDTQAASSFFHKSSIQLQQVLVLHGMKNPTSI